MSITAKQAPAPEVAGPGPTPTGVHRLVLVGAGLALAWVVPLACYLAGIAWLIPLLIVAGTAALLRVGATVLDRVVLAIALLLGLTGVAGLLFSVWPWGLHPVPVAGVALSALVVAAAAVRAPLAPPRWWRPSDGWVLGLGGAVGLLRLVPFLGAGFTERLALLAPGDDFARHFYLYDAIQRAGGYPFLDAPQTAGGLGSYPQGAHLTLALLDNFLRSSAAAPAASVAFTHLTFFHIAAYGYLGISLVWATRWVAGPWLTGWRRPAILVVVAGIAAFTDLVIMFVRGSVSQALAVALLALLVAILARPVRPVRGQVVLVTGILLALGWVYFLWLPIAAAAAAVTVVGYRHRLRRHWRFALAVAVPGAAAALVPTVLFTRAQDVLTAVLQGSALGVNRNLVLGVVLAASAGLLTRPALRSPVWRGYAAQLVITGGIAVVFVGQQLVRTGKVNYFGDKMIQALLVVGLVGLGAAGLLLRPELTGELPGRRRARWPRALPALAVAFALLGFAGGYPLTTYHMKDGRPAADSSWGLAQASGDIAAPEVAELVATAMRDRPATAGRVTWVVGALPATYDNYKATVFLTVLDRQAQGLAWRHIGLLSGLDGDWRELLEQFVAAYRAEVHLQLLVGNPDDAARLDRLRAAYPEADLQVVRIEPPALRVS